MITVKKHHDRITADMLVEIFEIASHVYGFNLDDAEKTAAEGYLRTDGISTALRGEAYPCPLRKGIHFIIWPKKGRGVDIDCSNDDDYGVTQRNVQFKKFLRQRGFM